MRRFDQKDWPWLERLREADAEPEDIDVVLCSHLHVDHVGWNTRLENGRWVPTFPNARYLIAKREWEHWTAAGASAMARTGDYMADSVLPVFATGQAELIADEHAVKSDIQIEPAPGHTPGLYMVRLAGTEGDAVLCSDLMHHPLQIKHPDWSTKFCVDPVQARITRTNFLAQHADGKTLVFPAHFQRRLAAASTRTAARIVSRSMASARSPGSALNRNHRRRIECRTGSSGPVQRSTSTSAVRRAWPLRRASRCPGRGSARWHCRARHSACSPSSAGSYQAPHDKLHDAGADRVGDDARRQGTRRAHCTRAPHRHRAMPRALASAGLIEIASRPATLPPALTGPRSIWLCSRSRGWLETRCSG